MASWALTRTSLLRKAEIALIGCLTEPLIKPCP
jgi:hypothetical protein